MDKSKYYRASKDDSQLQQFVDDVCASINNIIKNATTIKGTVLNVSEINTDLTPIEVIDNVPYYHKQEFAVADASGQKDLLTGESINSGDYVDISTYLAYTYAAHQMGLYLYSSKTGSPGLSECIVSTMETSYSFTNKAFEVVASMSDLTDASTQVCIPGCTAFYVKVSEDKSIITILYNIVSDSVHRLNEASDGEKSMPIYDARIPVLVNSDTGKTLVYDGSSFKTVILPPNVEKASGGQIISFLGLGSQNRLVKQTINMLKLYEHHLKVNAELTLLDDTVETISNCQITILSNSSAQITKYQYGIGNIVISNLSFNQQIMEYTGWPLCILPANEIFVQGAGYTNYSFFATLLIHASGSDAIATILPLKWLETEAKSFVITEVVSDAVIEQ